MICQLTHRVQVPQLTAQRMPGIGPQPEPVQALQAAARQQREIRVLDHHGNSWVIY
jgi:hypothetical protein